MRKIRKNSYFSARTKLEVIRVHWVGVNGVIGVIEEDLRMRQIEAGFEHKAG